MKDKEKQKITGFRIVDTSQSLRDNTTSKFWPQSLFHQLQAKLVNFTFTLLDKVF